MNWRIGFDGEKFNRVQATFLIPEYSGQRAIASLPCYPLEAHEDHHSLSRSLIQRGSTFRELCTKSKGHQMFDYKGEITFMHSYEEEQTFMALAFEMARRREPMPMLYGNDEVISPFFPDDLS